MDLTTDLNQTSGHDSLITSSFDSSEVVGSTPKIQPSIQKKRKFCDRNIIDSPQFSSTLNESLIDNLKDCTLEKHLIRPYHTPEKQRKIQPPLTSSPLIEKHEILYGNDYIKSNHRIIVSPFSKSGGDRCLTRLHKSFVRHNSLKLILNNPVIMENILKRLSDGDLYRVSMVSKSFRQALLNDNKAKRRFLSFKDNHKSNKENYVITPPSSPEYKCDSPPGPSNTSARFREFTKLARQLPNPDQTLNKCQKCERVAVVQNNLSQCQNKNCGLIICLLCGSSSTTFDKFVDKCKNSLLLDTALGDRSNYCNNEDFYYTSNSSFSHDSGVYSENDSSTPKVKRDLFTSKSAFGINNSRTGGRSFLKRCDVKYHFAPVVPNQKRSDGEWSSPERDVPKACSKQSKRNLKRLTR